MSSPAASSSPAEGSQGSPGEISGTLHYRNEVVRKLIHLCSLSIPVVYYFISKERALWILGPLLLAFLSVDIARHYIPPVGQWFSRWFGWLLRRHEQEGARKRLNGATYVLISAVICVAVFPKVITVTAFAILIISDSTSALIGRKFGKTPFFHKTLEGSTAFFISAVVVVLLSPKISYQPMEYVIGVLGAVVGAFVESLSGVFDDNLTVPLSISLVMWGLYAMFLPTLNVYQLG
jgi:dolichol kinase